MDETFQTIFLMERNLMLTHHDVCASLDLTEFRVGRRRHVDETREIKDQNKINIGFFFSNIMV